jgi:hypothetical protein
MAARRLLALAAAVAAASGAAAPRGARWRAGLRGAPAAPADQWFAQAVDHFAGNGVGPTFAQRFQVGSVEPPDRKQREPRRLERIVLKIPYRFLHY